MTGAMTDEQIREAIDALPPRRVNDLSRVLVGALVERVERGERALEELDAHKTEIDRLLNEQRAFVERIRELEAQLASKD